MWGPLMLSFVQFLTAGFTWLLFILICPESTEAQYGNHIQRTGQWDHSGTEHCHKYIKRQKTIASDQLKSGQLVDNLYNCLQLPSKNSPSGICPAAGIDPVVAAWRAVWEELWGRVPGPRATWRASTATENVCLTRTPSQ